MRFSSSATNAFVVLASCAVASVRASIFITSPISTTDWTAGANTITWLADTSDAAGVAPLASSFGPSTVTLMSGNAIQNTVLQTLGTVANPATTLSLAVTIDPKSGPNSDLYFIRFQSNAEPTTEAFSARFTLSGMTGTFSSTVQAQNSGITGSSVTSTTSSSSSSSSASSGKSSSTTSSSKTSSSSGTTTGTSTSSSHTSTSTTTTGSASGLLAKGCGWGITAVVAGAVWAAL